MLEETLTGSGAKSCYLPVGPGTRPVGLLESRVLWRAAVEGLSGEAVGCKTVWEQKFLEGCTQHRVILP